MDTLAPILPVMRKHGVSCDPKEFHNIVNIVFHEHESEIYDAIHKAMHANLDKLFKSLIDDLLMVISSMKLI
jgi:hypothetical protein